MDVKKFDIVLHTKKGIQLSDDIIVWSNYHVLNIKEDKTIVCNNIDELLQVEGIKELINDYSGEVVYHGGRGAEYKSNIKKQLTPQEIAENNALSEAQSYILSAYINSSIKAPKIDTKTIKIGDDINGKMISASIFYDNIPQYQHFIREYDARVINVTEKAVQLDWDTDYGHIKSWFPKSTIRSNSSFNKGLAYNEGLKLYANKLGIKRVTVDSVLKTSTVIDKIKTAGYFVPTYKDLKLD